VEAALVKRVKVRVPATTSNLGPAFDAAGLALSLYNELTLEWHQGSGEPIFEIEGEGAATLPRTAENVIARAAQTVLAGRSGRLVFKCHNRIPTARGLGSSAAAVVAGLLAANALLGKEALSQEDLLEYAVAFEGHPDNVAPALLGGLVGSVKTRQKPLAFTLDPHPDLRAVVCIPSFELATATARSVLPKTYLREDAVDNAARAFLLGSALEKGRWGRLAVAMEDRFHQPYRASLVKGMSSVIKAAQQAGACGAALSGAGPTIVALGPAGPDLDHVADAMRGAFSQHGVESRTLVLTVAKGAEVLECS
jgi:homoserine kinase